MKKKNKEIKESNKMECQLCKRILKDKKSMDKHKKTKTHLSILNDDRKCKTCTQKIPTKEPYYVTRCKSCYFEKNFQKDYENVGFLPQEEFLSNC
jgi:hypothetical protein